MTYLQYRSLILSEIQLHNILIARNHHSQLKSVKMKSNTVMSLVQNYIYSVDNGWNYILPTTLKSELEEGKEYFLLDSRKPQHYDSGHIEGAVNIFWLDLFKQENLAKLPTDMEIIICCYVGHTASQIMVLLQMLGFRARVLKFGMGKGPVIGVPVAGWENYGYPVVQG